LIHFYKRLPEYGLNVLSRNLSLAVIVPAV